MNMDEISIRSIQHYLYCPHRWGLIEIGRSWSENVFVTKANLMHQRVHEPDKYYISKGKREFTSVPVYNDRDEYNLYGITDCIEATESKQGIALPGYESKYHLSIIEYKPTKPKKNEYNTEDLMQVFAQKICVDYVFQTDCTAELYYADIKRRVKLPLQENYNEYDLYLRQIIAEMRKNIEAGRIPPISKGQKCNGCSMKDMCIPHGSRHKSFRDSIEKIGEGEI